VSQELIRKNTENTLHAVLIKGDLSSLSESEKISHLRSVCESLGLNPLTNPFKYINLNGKLILYAGRDATDQLRKIHSVGLTIVDRKKEDEIFLVTARAILPSGRTDESIGAVSVKGLHGDALANAYMKAETKAKRRVTLSICGMGFLDESEIETIPEAKHHVLPEKEEVKLVDELSMVNPVFYRHKSSDPTVDERTQLLQDTFALARKTQGSTTAATAFVKANMKERFSKEHSKELGLDELRELYCLMVQEQESVNI
jgi:hypothetical protein